jgi:hypothetical protein
MASADVEVIGIAAVLDARAAVVDGTDVSPGAARPDRGACEAVGCPAQPINRLISNSPSGFIISKVS